MRDCLKLLQGSIDRNDPAFFLLTQLAFFLLAATDGHAKNFSIYRHPGDQYKMAPLYDILSMWPYYGDGHNQFKRRKAGLAMVKMAEGVGAALDDVEALLPRNFPARTWDKISAGTKAEAKRFLTDAAGPD